MINRAVLTSLIYFCFAGISIAAVVPPVTPVVYETEIKGTTDFFSSPFTLDFYYNLSNPQISTLSGQTTQTYTATNGNAIAKLSIDNQNLYFNNLKSFTINYTTDNFFVLKQLDYDFEDKNGSVNVDLILPTRAVDVPSGFSIGGSDIATTFLGNPLPLGSFVYQEGQTSLNTDILSISSVVETRHGGTIVNPIPLQNLPTVPLPSSAPEFGAALIGLASLGYVAKRKKAAAA